MSETHRSQAKSPENTYLFDNNTAAMMAHLTDQAILFIENMGGLFPEQTDLANIQDVLDLASGPGAWVQEVAHQYAEMEITGVDISPKMVAYAQAQVHVQLLENVHFRQMDILDTFAFPDESFDMVNASILVTSVPALRFPQLLAECKRVLRPQGILRWTELEWGWVSTPAMEKIHNLHHEIIHRTGYGFSPSGHFLGVSHAMQPLLYKAGFEQIRNRVALSDVSYGTKIHRGALENARLLFHFLKEPLFSHNLITPQEYNDLYEQAMLEMQTEAFHCTGFFMTVCGTKQAGKQP